MVWRIASVATRSARRTIAGAHEASGFDGCIFDHAKKLEGEIAFNVLAEIFGAFHGWWCLWPDVSGHVFSSCLLVLGSGEAITFGVPFIVVRA